MREIIPRELREFLVKEVNVFAGPYFLPNCIDPVDWTNRQSVVPAWNRINQELQSLYACKNHKQALDKKRARIDSKLSDFGLKFDGKRIVRILPF